MVQSPWDDSVLGMGFVCKPELRHCTWWISGEDKGKVRREGAS